MLSLHGDGIFYDNSRKSFHIIIPGRYFMLIIGTLQYHQVFVDCCSGKSFYLPSGGNLLDIPPNEYIRIYIASDDSEEIRTAYESQIYIYQVL